MSTFFGLTALGPANPFARTSASLKCVHDVTDEQLITAYTQLVKSNSVLKNTARQARLAQQLLAPDEMILPIDDARLILLNLYECEPAQREIEVLHKHIRANADEFKQQESEQSIDFSSLFMTDRQFMKAIHATRQECPRINIEDTLTRSAHELLDARHRHVRSPVGPADLMTSPITTNSEYGFYTPAEIERSKQLERKSCEEPKYASALVRSGVY
jgi:hypothetical protein